MRAGIFRRTVSSWSVAVASLLVFSSGVIHAYVDDLVVESDYYQLAPKDQQYDRTVLVEKGRIAETQGNVLAQISKLDDEIHKIDKDLSKYRSSEARNILLLERRRLFRKRREYKAVVASYTEQQMRMTRDLSYNSPANRGSQGDAYENGDSDWSTGEESSGLHNPNWGKRDSGEAKKTVFKVKTEKNMKEVAEKISNSIYGEFNSDIYVELLAQNMGNTAINPRNLMAGDHIFIPYKVAMLTMMGINQKSLVDSTMEVLSAVKDPELKRDLIKYAVIADENAESKKKFVNVLVALKMHGRDVRRVQNCTNPFS